MNSAAPVHVLHQIAANNGWYTGSQLEWSFGPARYVHALRESFMRRAYRVAAARNPDRPVRVLEVGCGDGVNLFRLRDLKDASFWGCDYNPVRLERARALVPAAQFSQVEIEAGRPCPVPGGSHLMIFSHVIEHIAQDVAALAAIRSWLAPGGLCAFLTPNEGCLVARAGRKWVDPWIARETDHVHFYSSRSVRKLIRAAGWRVLRHSGEVLTLPSYRIQMGLLRRGWGYGLLRGLHFLAPCQTTGHMFVLEAA